MNLTTISSNNTKLEYIEEIMVRMAEYEEKSIKEFRSDLVEVKESSKNSDQKLDRIAEETAESSKRLDLKLDQVAEIIQNNAIESREESRLFNEKLDRLEIIMANNVIESREESRLLNEKLDRLSEQVFIVNETSKRQEHNIDRLVGIVETLVKVESNKAEPVVKNA